MTEFPISDRRTRFAIAARLWDACGDVITPRQVREIAGRVYIELDGEVDPLPIIKRELEAAGVPAERATPVVSLVLMVMNDMANGELAELRATTAQTK